MQEGIYSPDGHCRVFDAGANGTVSGNGVALVLLKRLSDALADSDHIHAVIHGTAINNDGSSKAEYTAPSVEGQAQVIALAQASAQCDPDTIGYVEAHGTGTLLGDPIEVAALTRVFGDGRRRSSPCWIGSVKSNIGHLYAVAGVAGLIKAALSLEHRELVPSLNFGNPNPQIDFAAGPFKVNTELRHWESPQGAPRRAGVRSFGFGGTNAHTVLEEAPALESSGPSREWQLLCLSAKTDGRSGASHCESGPAPERASRYQPGLTLLIRCSSDDASLESLRCRVSRCGRCAVGSGRRRCATLDPQCSKRRQTLGALYVHRTRCPAPQHGAWPLPHGSVVPRDS